MASDGRVWFPRNRIFLFRFAKSIFRSGEILSKNSAKRNEILLHLSIYVYVNKYISVCKNVNMSVYVYLTWLTCTYPCCMSMLHVLATCPCCMSFLHVHAVCPCRMSMAQVYAACPCCMSLLLVHSVCPRCISIFCPWCMSVLNIRTSS